MTTYTLITRGSQLARQQTTLVQQQLQQAYPQIQWSIKAVSTPGDQNQADPLQTIGGKQVFASTLQNALLDHQADIAVHSLKDLSVHPHPELTLAAFCQREDPRDVVVTSHNASLKELPPGCTIGTASPRRQALLMHYHPDLKVALCRGNVNTRLKKLADNQYDALILAAAGLHRLQLQQHISEYLDPLTFTPAIGQGAIAVECRTSDLALQQHLSDALNHENTTACVSAERAVNRIVGGDCFAAIAAHATLSGNTLNIQAWVSTPDGATYLRDHVSGPVDQSVVLGEQLGHQLNTQGAQSLLKQGDAHG